MELFSVIQTTAVNTWQMVLIYIYMGVSAYWSECAVYFCVYVCVYVCVCDIKSEYQQNITLCVRPQ